MSMFDKKETKKLSTPDPELTKAAAHGDPMATALAAEVAKEEQHPATKAIMARRAAEPEGGFEGLARRLYEAGGHDVHCPAASNTGSNCSCMWGAPAGEAYEVLGYRAADEAKRDEEAAERKKRKLLE